jgi:hypothetical protein
MIRQIYTQTQETPAEYTYTNPAACLKCGAEHDLDQGDFNTIDGYGIICPDCSLLCEHCENPVHELAPNRFTLHFMQDGVIQRRSKYMHGSCEVAAITDIPIIRGAGV